MSINKNSPIYFSHIDTRVLPHIQYNYHVIENISNYYVKDCQLNYGGSLCTKMPIINDTTPLYLLSISQFDNAMFHWVSECALYFELYTQFKMKYPQIKLVFSYKQNYHAIFAKYFNIEPSDIVYNISTPNICFYPHPIHLLNDYIACSSYNPIIYRYMGLYTNSNTVEKQIDILILPRQSKSNSIFSSGRRINDCQDIINNIPNAVVFHTDDVDDLRQQIRIVSMAKTIIVTDGSPYFLNGLISRNSNIIVLGNIVELQINDFIRKKIIHEYITENNKNTVHFIPYVNCSFEHGVFNYSQVLPYL